jgi:hypothetical protein
MIMIDPSGFGGEKTPGFFKVGGSIDTERD